MTESDQKLRGRLCVFGSRTLNDQRVYEIIKDEIEKRDPVMIVTSAEPNGPCEVAKRVAKDLAVPLKVYFLNFKYKAGAFEHRSKDILRDSDHVVFIHDGKSKGTANEMKLAQKMAVPLTYYKLEPEPKREELFGELKTLEL